MKVTVVTAEPKGMWPHHEFEKAQVDTTHDHYLVVKVGRGTHLFPHHNVVRVILEREDEPLSVKGYGHTLDELRRKSPEHPLLDRLNADLDELRQQIFVGELPLDVSIGGIGINEPCPHGLGLKIFCIQCFAPEGP